MLSVSSFAASASPVSNAILSASFGVAISTTPSPSSSSVSALRSFRPSISSSPPPPPRGVSCSAMRIMAPSKLRRKRRGGGSSSGNDGSGSDDEFAASGGGGSGMGGMNGRGWGGSSGGSDDDWRDHESFRAVAWERAFYEAGWMWFAVSGRRDSPKSSVVTSSPLLQSSTLSSTGSSLRFSLAIIRVHLSPGCALRRSPDSMPGCQVECSPVL
jgi:hypothetical protein